MRSFLEIFRFEIGLQGRSALFWALLMMTAFIHFCAARKWGIDISLGGMKDAAGLPYNSAPAIIQNALTLSLLSALPAIALVTGAATRDGERRMNPLFHTQPVSPTAYASGRLAGGMALCLITVMAGVAGAAASLALPGIDPMHLMPFWAAPWFHALFTIAIPNMLIIGMLAFAAAITARSMAAAYCVALTLPLIPIISLPHLGQDGLAWLGLADPFGAVASVHVTRFWTREELITQLPGGMFWANRLLWLGMAGAVLVAAVGRFRFSAQAQRWQGLTRARRPAPAPSAQKVAVLRRFDIVGTWRLIGSQLRLDLRAILRSAPFHVVALLIIAACIDRFGARSSTIYNAVQLPLTSRLVGFLDTGIAMQMILAIAYYAGLLVHRERAARVADIIDASPSPTGALVLARLTALAGMVTILLLLAIGTFIGLQLGHGFDDVQPGLYLHALFIYGFNHYALIVPALLMHLLVANRWLGTLLFLLFVAAGLSLRPLGLENVLYNLQLASPTYSDMNGWGHFTPRHMSLMVYWTGIMVVLTVLAVVAAPCGHHRRLGEWRARLTQPLRLTALCGLMGATLSGGWVYYNTHIRNLYVTGSNLEDRAARYEREYGRYAGLPQPVVTDMNVAVDFFPADRRVESRGRMELRNPSAVPITDLFLTLNPALEIGSLELEGAQLVEAEPMLGVRRYRLDRPLAVGEAMTGRWQFSWRNDGFTNSVTSNAVAENGSNIEGEDILPMFGYRRGRELDDPAARARQGLPPAAPLPSLDDDGARNSVENHFAAARFQAVLGTSGDQIAVTSGKLAGEWQADGRRYFQYEGHFPIYLAFASARYAVMRTVVDGVTLELFHDPRHAGSARAIMDTMKGGLAYYSREYSPYPLETFRIFEYPRYSARVHAMAGAVSYSEAAGFTLDLRPGQADIVAAHELAHMWWGGQVRSPRIQGQQVINEGLATFASFMLVEHMQGRAAALPYVAFQRSQYLDAYSRIDPARPVIRAEAGPDAYSRASLALYTLRDVVGADAVNGALKGFLARYGNRPPPLPTTRELVDALRAAAGPEHQSLITDLFEKITFYDVALAGAESRKADSGYAVEIMVKARKTQVDDQGRETEAPLHAPFDIVIHGVDGQPLHAAKHWLSSGEQAIRLNVTSRPGRVAIDPNGMMLDREPDDNALDLSTR